MSLKWEDAYLSGVEKIDAEHQELFDMLNRLELLIERGRNSGPQADHLIQSIETSMQTHFNYEESCMMRHRCPASQKNKKAHDRFLDLLSKFHEERKENGADLLLLQKFHRTAESWVLSHLINIDRHIASCVRRKITTGGLDRKKQREISTKS